MSRSLFVLAVLTVFATTAQSSQAQVTRGGLISQMGANRFGLERIWFTQVALDRSRGRVAYVTQHVSSTDSYTVFQVKHDGGEFVFREHDLDRFGDPLGKEDAQKLAEQKVEDLKLAKLNPQMTTEVIPEITLYFMTDRGVVHAVNAETGRTRWTTAVGSSSRTSEACGANDSYVAAVNGSDLYVLDVRDGKVLWQRRVRGAPGAGPVVTGRLVFVPMVNGRIESYRLEDHRQPPWVFQSHGRAVVQPVYTGSVIAWPTDRGHLYVAEGDRTEIRYRLEAHDSIVAEAAPLPPNRIVTASTDGYLYCLHQVSGDILWRFSTGEPIVVSPLVIGERVYVITVDDNLFCIVADSGAENWQAAGIRTFVAASQGRLYCLNSAGRLTIIDASTGARIGTLPTETLDLAFVNKQTDRIIVGTKTGVVQCLREIGQKWPLIHAGILEEEPAERRPKKKATEPKPEPTSPADANPFGTSPAGADPFGGGAGGTSDDPFGGGTGGTSDDPFGGGTGGTSDDPFGGGSTSDDPFGGGGSGGTTDDPFGDSF